MIISDLLIMKIECQEMDIPKGWEFPSVKKMEKCIKFVSVLLP